MPRTSRCRSPEVTATVVQPDGGRSTLTLKAVEGGAAKACIAGQFTAVQEGDYRVELRPPQWRTGRVAGPRSPRAGRGTGDQTAGTERPAAVGPGPDHRRRVLCRYRCGGRTRAAPAPLVNVLQPQDQVTYLPGTAGPRLRAAADGLADGPDLRRAVPGMAPPAAEPTGVKRRGVTVISDQCTKRTNDH